MGLLNPWLALGTLGVGIPILIHLLNRYRQRRVPWAAMDLLRQAVRVRSWQLRLEDIALLALRCLAVLLVTLALARPTLQPPGGKWFAGEPSVAAVIAIDGSMSMGHKPGLHSRFDNAIAKVKQIAGTLRPGNPLTVVLMGQRPRIVLRNVAYDEQRLADALRDLAPLPEGLNLEASLTELRPLLAETKASRRELYVVTDTHTRAWRNLTDKAKDQFRQLGKVGQTIVVPVACDGSDNVAVTKLDLVSGTLRPGSIARYAAEVRNLGLRPAEKVQVDLLLDDVRVDQRQVERIEAGASVPVVLFAPLVKGGTARLTAQVATDALPADDVRRAIVQVGQSTRILCVDGNPSDEPYRSASGYLKTALLPREFDEPDNALKLTTISWLALPNQRLADFDVVILANVAEVPQEQADALYDFVRGGGGLVVFVGNNTNAAVMNKRLRHSDEPILPAALVESAGELSERSAGLPLELSTLDHPLSRAIDLIQKDLLAEARFHRWMKVQPSADARTVLSLAGGVPLLLERPLGRGRVLLCTTSADRSWSSMVLNPMYVVLIQQAMVYLTRQAHEMPISVGQSLVLPMPQHGAGEKIRWQAPGGQAGEAQVVQRHGECVVELPPAEQAGFYEVYAQANAAPLVVAVNADLAGSDVRVLDPAKATEALAGLPVRVLDQNQEIASAVRDGRVGREIWRTLLIGGLGMMIVEAFVARRIGRRGRGQPIREEAAA